MPETAEQIIVAQPLPPTVLEVKQPAIPNPPVERVTTPDAMGAEYLSTFQKLLLQNSSAKGTAAPGQIPHDAQPAIEQPALISVPKGFSVIGEELSAMGEELADRHNGDRGKMRTAPSDKLNKLEKKRIDLMSGQSAAAQPKKRRWFGWN